jgi:hypothetical protein
MPNPPEERCAPAQAFADETTDRSDRPRRRVPPTGSEPSDATAVDQLLRSRRFADRIQVRTDAVRLWSALIELEIAAVQDDVAVARASAVGHSGRADHDRVPETPTALQITADQPHRATDSQFAHLLAARILESFEARAVRRRPPNDKGRKLALLQAQVDLRALVSRRIDQLVSESREEGATWAEIGQALHVTRQTAHQRYH